MNIALEIICFVILAIPTAWELWDDRNGETPEQKKKDVSKRATLICICSCVSSLIHDYSEWGNGDYIDGLLTFAKSIFLSFAIFFLAFDYCINLILGRKPWYSYLSKSPIDSVWSSWNWRWRMAIRGAVFVGVMIWYFIKV